jgi:YD repeat-containing protein
VSGQSAMFSSSVCDPNTGLTTSTTDLNGKTTTYSYDAMLRSTITNYPDGGSKTVSYSGGSLGRSLELIGG